MILAMAEASRAAQAAQNFRQKGCTMDCIWELQSLRRNSCNVDLKKCLLDEPTHSMLSFKSTRRMLNAVSTHLLTSRNPLRWFEDL